MAGGAGWLRGQQLWGRRHPGPGRALRAVSAGRARRFGRDPKRRCGRAEWNHGFAWARSRLLPGTAQRASGAEPTLPWVSS